MEIKIPFITNDNKNLVTVDDKVYYVKDYQQDVTIGFTINLYQNTAEINRVNKSDFIESIGDIQGVLREVTSVTDVTIVVQYPKYIDFNYVYIDVFKRYYFVTDIRVINNQLYEIDLSADVLMSYKDAILRLPAFIDRNEFTSNPMLLDKKRVIEQGYDIEVADINNKLFYQDGQPSDDTLLNYHYVINGYKIKSSSI